MKLAQLQAPVPLHARCWTSSIPDTKRGWKISTVVCGPSPGQQHGAQRAMAASAAANLHTTAQPQSQDAPETETTQQNTPLSTSVDVCEAITLPPEHSMAAALQALRIAAQDIPVRHGRCSSGLVRLEVPLPRSQKALWWLRGQAEPGQTNALLQPLVYFSPRRSPAPETEGSTAASAAGVGAGSVAGAGAAWLWKGPAGRQLDGAAMADMRRFLGAAHPRVRVFGGSRFDPGKAPSPEWEEFGSYYFMLPRIEYTELAGCGLLACTVAWDAAHNAVNGTTAVSGFSSLGAAVMDAVAALEAVRPPASPSAGAPQVSPGAAQHLPAEIEWGARLSAVHDQLHAVPADTLSDDNTGILKVNPNAALDEYLRNGQQGLDELLAALDAGFQGVVSSSSSESDEEESTGNGAGGGQRKRTRGLTKVVLARRTDVQVEGKVDPISLLEALQERDPRAYQVLLQLPSGATFLSSTPECLYTRTGTAVASEAVAGTRARGAGGDVERDFWLAFDLLQSHKDDVEFGVVRDWVQRTLSTLCDGVKVEVAKSVLKQANVQHLYAKLAGVLRPGAGDAELLSALHPTPAVCGQPRTEALGMLSEVEPFDRGFYSGPFGWVAHDAAEFVVAIRSALVHPDAAVLDRAAGHIADTSSASPHTWSSEYAPHPTAVSLFAGVGIVSGSDVAAEWAELNLKIAQFQRLLVSPKRLDEAPNAAALWARLMVEELCRLGCNTFCVAPGSRSSPLTTAIAQHPRARIVPCIDERSLCFWALGYGRATGRPAVVVTSSGTAVANLLPAAVEASQSNVPLLMLTADRPTELRDTGANQTIDQVKIFGSYVRWECDVGAPSDQVPARVALTTIGAAVRHACATHAGPVHVNCQFRDPLAPAPEPWDRGCLAGLDRWEQGNEPFTSNTSMHVLINAGGSSVSSLSAHIDNSALNGVLSTLKHAKRGLIVVGELTSPEDAVAAVQLGKFLGWPVAADVLSGIRVGSVPSEGASLVLVNHFDHILLAREHWPELQPDVVLQLGGHVTSKRTSQFLEWAAQGAEPGQEATSWIFVDRTPRRHDQGHLVTHRLQSSINGLLGALRLATYDHDVPRPAGVMAEAEQSYCILLTALDAVASSAIDDMLQSFHDLTEPGVARLLSRELPPGEGLFIGNSMPIRDLDMYGLPAQYGATQTLTKLNESLAPQGVVGTGLGAPVGANRGASGIDGVLSTAAGFADGLGRGCTLVVGDISFLHDINGLNLLRSGEMRPPLTVVLVNNGGGGIFSFLPIAEHLPDDVFTPLWATPQHVDLAGMCRAHSIPHLKVGSAAELRKALHSAWGLNRHSVIEVVTSRTSNVDRHREVQAAVQSAVTSILRKRLERNLSKPELQSCLAINSAKWTAFELPLSRPLTTESGAGAAYRRGLLLEVEIGTNNSPVKGVGEVSPLPGLHAESLEDATAQIAAVCEAISGARVPLDCALLHGGMASWMLAAGIDVDQLYPSVRCALEAAVLSCISQHLKQPIASVALSRSTALPAAPAPRVNGLLDPSKYDTIEAATAAAVALVTESGFSALKVKVGRMPPPRGPLYDAATVLAIRAAVGPGVVLRADANQAWCLEDAIAFGSAVAPTGLEYVEEPLADPTFEALAAFHRATGVHTALDESIDAGRYLCESSGGKVPEGVAAVVLKPLVLGGFERTLAIVRRAQRLGVRPVISSAFESPVGLKQLAQLAVLVDPDCSTHHGLATEDWFGEGVPRVTENMAHGQLPRRCIPTGDQPWSGVLNIAAALAPFLSQRPALSADSFTVATAAAQISPDLTVDWQVLEAACAPGQGHATPVVFVHGMFGCAPEWKPYMAALRTVGRPSWAVYLPYHGETSVHASSTENCPSRHPKSLDVAANALAALLDTKGVTRCTIVGYSMGARIALLLAARRPELFERVVSIGGTPGLEGDAACAERAAADGVLAGTLRQQLLPGFLQSHWYTAPIWCSLRKHPFFDTLVGTRSRELGAYYEELAEVLEQASPGRTSPVWSELEQRAQEGTLPPVTMIVGALDTKFTAIAEDLKRRLGGGHVDVVIVPAAGHAAHVERQLYVMRLLMEQLA